MIETRDSEVDVEQLMAEIRAAVEKREADGERSLIGASLELYDMLLNVEHAPTLQTELPPVSLQPEFVPREDDHYHVDDLLKYHDHTFVWNAYRAILKREPDEPGLRQFLEKLRSGRFNKIDVLARLRFSSEGRSRNVRVDGLARPAFVRKLYRVPVFGYLLEMLVGVARLPALMRSQRQFEGYALAQQELLANQINQLSQMTLPALESFSRELANLSAEQRKFTELQNQQLVGLYGEQLDILARLKGLREDVEALLERHEAAPSASSPPQPTNVRAYRAEMPHQLEELFALFAEQFRGEPEEVKKGLRFYLPFIKPNGVGAEILDLGCGRGEWLELLLEEGLKGRGVEVNGALAAQARRKGFEVVEQDALDYLRRLPDQSLDAVTGFHFIEHLEFEVLIELFGEIARTLRPGGLVIFETPNPKNLVVGACNFYADPTHLKPLFPETVQFVFDKCGFEDVRIEYLNPVEGSPFKEDDEGARALHSWFFGPRDYAVIARKSSAEKVAGRDDLSVSVRVGGKVETARLERHVTQRGREFYVRNGTDDLIAFSDVLMTNKKYNLPAEFSDEDVIIDVGAHIGAFSFAVLERGAGKVYALEAHPVNHAVAVKNLAQFGDRAVCRNQAVWRSDEAAQTLYNDDIRGQTQTAGISVLWNESGVPVRTVGLDELLFEATDNFSRKIRLLKLDCEGAEYPILFSSRHLTMIEEMCGEYHEIKLEMIPDRAHVDDRFRPDPQGLKEFLESQGWEVSLEPKGATDGIFHAWRKR